MNIAAEVFCLDAFGVELEGFGNFTDGGCVQFGDFGQYVDGQVCVAALDGLFDFVAQFGFCTADDDCRAGLPWRRAVRCVHVDCGDCFFDGFFLCADDCDDGQAEVTCDLDVQVEFD